MNQFLLIGKVARQPQLQKTSSGLEFTHLIVDTTRPYKNKEGYYDIDRFQVILWKDLASEVCNNVDAGDALLIKGRVQANNFEKDGDIIFKSEMIGENVSLLSQLF